MPIYNGTSGHDIINGDQGAAGEADTINGLNGDDSLNGLGGNDIIDGGAGRDVLVGGAGIDWVRYDSATGAVTVSLAATGAQNTQGAGIDTLSGFENMFGSEFSDILAGDDAANAIDGRSGNDVIDGGSGNDELTGGNGDDVLRGGTYNDLLNGNGGDDVLEGGNHTDRLDGGDGNDSASYATAAARVFVSLGITGAQSTSGGGTDTLANIENLIGSAFDDRLTGAANANSLTGGGGFDTLSGLGGNDMLSGGDGDDVLIGGDGDDVVTGGAGIDVASYAGAAAGVTVSLLVSAPQATGGAGSDTLASIEGLTGSDHADILAGNADANRLSGGNGNDRIAGDLGNDFIDGGAGIDTLDYSGVGAAITINLTRVSAFDTGGGGIDTIRSVENVTGTAFDDTLLGNEFANILSGGGGNDSLVGGLSNDTLDGGTGIDTANYASATSGVRVNLAITTTQTTLGAGGDTLLNVENLNGTGFDDVLSGNAGNNLLMGNGGSDILSGGLGNDVLNGGQGIDTVSYDAAAAGVTVNLALTTAQNTGAAGIDTLSYFEDVVGSAFADRLTGSVQNNRISGGAGDDILDGGIGSGADTLDGGSGNDILNGAIGNDVLIGGAGRDTLTGGAGVDRFVYLATTNSPASSNADRITDLAAGDVLDLSAIDANVNTAATNDAFVKVTSFTGVAGQLTLAFAAGTNTTTLLGDSDGNGLADFSILFTGDVTPLTGSWVL